MRRLRSIASVALLASFLIVPLTAPAAEAPAALTQTPGPGLSATPLAVTAATAASASTPVLARVHAVAGFERAGWPVDLGTPGAGFPYTPTLHDIDGDGAEEIFLTGGHTFALRGDGSFVPGWPTVEMADMGYGTNDNKPGPSAADMDHDGRPEILWSERDWWAGGSRMWCFNGKDPDGVSLPGFPQQAPDEASNALDVPFVLGDTDGDGDLEAWGPHSLGNNFVHYRLSAFDHLGGRLFTTQIGRTENMLSLYYGDLAGDGEPEMFSVSWLSPAVRLHAFTSTGAEQSGFPRTLLSLTAGSLPFGPPIAADLDDDGDLEILLGQWDGGGSRVLARHHDGAEVAGFPVEIATDSQLFYIGLGDLTGDGEPELVATDNQLSADYRVHAIDLASGVPLPGWPVAVPDWPEGFPAVADVDGDGYQDVCFVTAGGELRAVDRTGHMLPDYPRQMSAPSISGVAVGDIDGDGLFELVAATWDGWVYAWDTPAAADPERADWRMRNLNARNTGVYGDSDGAAAVADEASGARLRLLVTPTLARDRVHFSGPPFAAGRGIEVFSCDGRRVALIPLTPEGTGVWSDAARHPSGVYFARVPGIVGAGVIRLVLTP